MSVLARLGRAWGRLHLPFWPRQPRIPEGLWGDVLQAHPFLAWREADELQCLRDMSGRFLQRKEFHGAHGFEVTDFVALSVAAQACLPVLHLGLDWYDGFVGIVMHPGPVVARREWADELGLVHTHEEELVGEVHDGGPVMLSWGDGVAASTHIDHPAFNVVIHEFAHLIDMRDGAVDGIPPLPRASRSRWCEVITVAFDRFDERSACGYPSVVDAYGAHDIGEFFAVTAEAFFTRPRELLQENRELYGLYSSFFRQNPAPHSP